MIQATGRSLKWNYRGDRWRQMNPQGKEVAGDVLKQEPQRQRSNNETDPPGDVQGQPWDSEVAASRFPSLPLESSSGPGSPPRALSTLP